MKPLFTVTISDPQDGTDELKIVIDNHEKKNGRELMTVLATVARNMAAITLETGLKLGLTESQAVAFLEGDA